MTELRVSNFRPTESSSLGGFRGEREWLPLWAAWLVTAVVVLTESVIYFEIIRHQTGAFGDLIGRVGNFQDLKSTNNIYAHFAFEAFTYPPGGILLLCPIVLIPVRFLGAIWTVGTLAALAATFFFIIRRFISQPASNALLIAAALTVLSPIAFPAIYDTIFWGQLGTVLTLIVVVDYLVIRGDMQGVLAGLATTIKIFPGFIIVLWLIRRQYRQAFTALATVIVTTLIASALWFHSSLTFFQEEFRGGRELGHFSTATTAQASSSIVDLFLHPPFFLGHLSPAGTMVVAAVVAIIGLVAAGGAASRGFEFTALVIGIVLSTICSPIAWNHYFAFLPIMLFLPFEIGWRRWTTRFAYFALAVNTIPWHRWKLAGAIQVLLPKGKLYLSYAAQDATVISMLLVVLVAVIEFWPRSETLALWQRVRPRGDRRGDTRIETMPVDRVATVNK